MNNAPFQGIQSAVKATGLSAFYLRRGCRNGTVPHVRVGQKYMVNVPALLRRLDVPMEEVG